jgi:hypothetical protein
MQPLHERVGRWIEAHAAGRRLPQSVGGAYQSGTEAKPETIPVADKCVDASGGARQSRTQVVAFRDGRCQ